MTSWNLEKWLPVSTTLAFGAGIGIFTTILTYRITNMICLATEISALREEVHQLTIVLREKNNVTQHNGIPIQKNKKGDDFEEDCFEDASELIEDTSSLHETCKISTFKVNL